MKPSSAKRISRTKEAEEFVPRIVRPIVRILKASGISDALIRKSVAHACKQHARERVRGVAVDLGKYWQLADVVMIWARDPEFIDESGAPKKLNIANSPPSFQRLIDKAGVPVKVSEALQVLLLLDSIRLCERNKKIRLVSHVLLSVTPRRFVVAAVLDEMRRFIETIEHNVCENPDALNGRMQRTVLCESLDPERFPEAQRFVRQNAQSFLDALDEKLSTCKSAKPGGPLGYGAGIYVFVDHKKRPTSRRQRS